MKQITSLILAAVLVFSLCACGGQSAEITLTGVSTFSGGYGTRNPSGVPGQRGPGRNPGGGRRGR